MRGGKSIKIETVAQEIVDATAPFVRTRTINIMDTDGIIIASSDPVRIGTFHQGAKEAVQNRHTVHIHRENLTQYPGAREGINMPIIKDEQILGVVGIYGEPEEVCETASLLSVCVGLYLNQIYAMQANQLQKDIRLDLLKLLISGGSISIDDIQGFASLLSVRLQLPVSVIIIGTASHDKIVLLKTLEQMESLLLEREVINANRDVYGILNDSLVVLKPAPVGFRTEQFLEDIRDTVYTGLKITTTVSAGSPCDRWAGVPASYKEAIHLSRLCRNQCSSTEMPNHRRLYLLSNTASDAVQRMIEPMYCQLCKGVGEDNIEWMLTTIRTYCEVSCSISKAAERLHVHKNTFIYRIKKVFALLHLDKEDHFTQEYFLQLVLLYHDGRFRS